MMQSGFRAALLDPALAVPAGLTGPDGRPVGKRFDVYRNNVVMSLTEALQSSFPVMRKVLGDAFFDAMAGIYLRAHPPTSPLLMYYGADMPGFVAEFEPAQRFGYLPDIARLELALRRSYHAADARPVDGQGLAALQPDQLEHLRLVLVPACGLVRSGWPIHAIWRFNSDVEAPKPVMRAEDVLILRPGFDAVPHLLPPGAGVLVAALMDGKPLGEAVEMAPDADLGTTLGLLMQGGAIHSYRCDVP